jgi:arylsulfatase A-like enzyme
MANKPNVVFILTDDLGYGDLGCYGQQVIQTPRLDQMAGEGLRYTDCYAGSTVCAPSRCTLMTGRDTGHCYVRSNARIPLRPDDRTVAEMFKDAGYATGIVGKWGLGEPETTGIPNRKGFDYWFGYLNQRHAHDYYPEYLWLNEDMVTLEGNLDGRREQYSHDLFTDHALQFVRDHQSDPFFLYLAYTIPHANNELGRETGDGMEVPDYGIYEDEDWPSPMKGHAAMISRMDRDCGRLLDLLGELGIDENTLVILTSDNGPHMEGGADPAFFNSWGPLRGYKRDLHDGGIRVPAIARWPGTIEAGSQSNYPWAFWDFFPTMADLVGQPAPEPTEGVSILPTLYGEPGPEREYLYWEFQSKQFMQAVRMGKWKAIRHGLTQLTKLFNLDEDIGETKNLAGDHPDIVAEAGRLFDDARVDAEEFPVEDLPD